MEQSPLDDTAVSQQVPPSNTHGTIVGEGLAAARSCLAASSSSSSSICSTLVQAPPPAALSFRDPTVSTGFDVYTCPEAPPALLAEAMNTSHRRPLTLMEEQLEAAMSAPDSSLGLEWMNIGSPAKPEEADIDVYLSPRPIGTKWDIFKSPGHHTIGIEVPMSPMDIAAMLSPEKPRPADVSMNASPVKTHAANLISDPWDDQMIRKLLLALTPPLTNHPHCVTWQCSVPAISPKTTISMGMPSLTNIPKGCFSFIHNQPSI